MAQRYGIMKASACTLRCDPTAMARIQRESLGVSGRVGGSTRSARGVGMPYYPPAAFLLQHRCPAADEVECATFKIGFESVPKDRPRHRIRNVWLYLERPVPEVLHLRDFRDEVMVAVVRPAAIDSSALDYGELRARVEGIQRSQIAGFGRLEEGFEGGCDTALFGGLASARNSGFANVRPDVVRSGVVVQRKPDFRSTRSP